MNFKWLRYLVLVLLCSCAGFNRNCYSYSAGAFGSNWIIVQYRIDGSPINCWQLRDVSIPNEPGSDEIYWFGTSSRNLVHITGWYNRVQVVNNQFKSAVDLIGIDLTRCQNGR